MRFVHFNEKDIKKGKLFPGLVFSSKDQLREAITWYAILHRKPLWIATNDKKRFSVKCGYPCNFAVWASQDSKLPPGDFCIKTVRRHHKGCPDEPVKLCGSTFLAKVMEDKIRLLPDITLKQIQVFVDELFHIKIGLFIARRTRLLAKQKIEGDHRDQFKMCFKM